MLRTHSAFFRSFKRQSSQCLMDIKNTTSRRGSFHHVTLGGSRTEETRGCHADGGNRTLCAGQRGRSRLSLTLALAWLRTSPQCSQAAGSTFSVGLLAFLPLQHLLQRKHEMSCLTTFSSTPKENSHMRTVCGSFFRSDLHEKSQCHRFCWSKQGTARTSRHKGKRNCL